MKLRLLAMRWAMVAAGAAGILVCTADAADFAPVEIVERAPSDTEPPIHMACYTHASGLAMIGPAGISPDAGRTWKPYTQTPDFTAGLPHGYRREPFPSVIDPKSGRIVNVYNALDTPGLDPNIIEPPIALNSYYLRYRVSADAGRTWLFDEPVIQHGFSRDHPVDGVWLAKNGVFFGDIGSIPLFTSRNELLVPVQICPLGPDGKLANPGGGFTYQDAAILIGAWSEDSRLKWDLAERVAGDPARSTRGLFEPTLAELPDKRILMILRGSNSNKQGNRLPSYKWRSVSSDGGHTWSNPEPWTYSEGTPFFSPSSMSQLFRHSSGRIFWIGNITPENADGNLPRWPLVIGEVDPTNLGLVKHSIVELDSKKPGEARVDLSHFRAQEDVETKQIVLTAPKGLDGYKSTTWTTYRLKLENSNSSTAP
jgi:hypothetical protein